MVSQSDIAQKLGISRGSVNQVLTSSPHCRVSDKLRRKILETARAMGYPIQDKRAANALSSTIAYVLCKPKVRKKIFPDEWHLDLMCHIQREAQKHQQDMLFFAADDHPRTQHAVAMKIARIRPAGVILDGEIHRSMVFEFMKLNIPLLLSGMLEFAREPQWVHRIATVALDIQHNLDLMVDKLYKRGCRRIGMIIDPGVLYSNKVLVTEYRRALQKRGIAINPAWVQTYEGYPDARLLDRYRERGIQIDGLIITADLLKALSQAVLENRLPAPLDRIAASINHHECRQAGLKGLICFDDAIPHVAQVTYDHLRHIITHPHDCSHIQIPTQLYEWPTEDEEEPEQV